LENRVKLRGADSAKLGLASKSGLFDVTKQRMELAIAERAVRTIFSTFSYAAGLTDCPLPDMNAIAKAGGTHYNTDLRGGEGHMEVGKLVMNIEHKKAHMTLSVKPFGCMPSAGVSDGVQSRITGLYPDAIFCPVETSGDGAVNFYSRVQMFLFKAKARAEQEFAQALDRSGLTLADAHALADRRGLQRALHRSPHVATGTGANLAHQVATIRAQSPRFSWPKMRLPSFSHAS
jgi:predicted nucleotide-binding protein (sugar kinase/HSP70/actin superfamily)